MTKNVPATCCAAIVGSLGLKYFPFIGTAVGLQLLRAHQPYDFEAIRYAWNVMLFTTPWLLFSSLFSAQFIFTSRKNGVAKSQLPPFPLLGPTDSLSVVLGELHEARRPVPIDSPSWLTIPAKGLHTGVAVIGAIGSGKTAGCILPYARQILNYRAEDPLRKIGGIVLEVKGDLTSQIREMLRAAGRVEDYLEVSLTGSYRYNPLHNDLDAFSLAFSIASLITALYGKGKDPFWQQAYSNLVKFIILLHKVVDEYVTLNQVYECAINPGKLQAKLQQGEALFAELQQRTLPISFLLIDPATYGQSNRLDASAKWEDWKGLLRAPFSKSLEELLNEEGLVYHVAVEPAELDAAAVTRRMEAFEACKRWFTDDWTRIDTKLRTSIVQGISVFLSSFDENADLKRVFCPPKECYNPKLNADGRYGVPLPAFSSLIEGGRVVGLNFSMANNPGIARIIGTWLKQDYQRAMLNRIPRMSANPKQYFRDSLFLVDEFQSFATVGEDNPSGDEKFFALSRQSKCIGIVAFQSISSLKSTLPGDSWRTLLQQFRTKIFLSLSDDFSAKTASDMCGSDEQLLPSYTISESGPDTRVSLLSGRALAHKTGLNMTKAFSMGIRPVFQPKVFSELKNAQAICLAFNGVDPLPPQFLYLKFAHLDRSMNYFEQLERRLL